MGDGYLGLSASHKAEVVEAAMNEIEERRRYDRHQTVLLFFISSETCKGEFQEMTCRQLLHLIQKEVKSIDKLSFDRSNIERQAFQRQFDAAAKSAGIIKSELVGMDLSEHGTGRDQSQQASPASSGKELDVNALLKELETLRNRVNQLESGGVGIAGGDSQSQSLPPLPQRNAGSRPAAPAASTSATALTTASAFSQPPPMFAASPAASHNINTNSSKRRMSGLQMSSSAITGNSAAIPIRIRDVRRLDFNVNSNEELSIQVRFSFSLFLFSI